METLGHYAATTPLREQEATAGGSQAGAAVRAFSGIDLVTGMPVVVYRFAGPLPLLPSSLGENIPTLLEAAEDAAGTHLVYAAVPGLSPLVPPLSGERLAWAVRALAVAIRDAHAAGFVHGNLRPAYLRARGSHLLLYGVGLPWPDDRESPYRAPEGPGKPAADIYAAGKVLRELAGGPTSPELNALLDACSSATPSDRPTAAAFLDALQALPPAVFEPPRRKGRSKAAIPVIEAPAKEPDGPTSTASLAGRQAEPPPVAAPEVQQAAVGPPAEPSPAKVEIATPVAPPAESKAEPEPSPAPAEPVPPEVAQPVSPPVQDEQPRPQAEPMLATAPAEYPSIPLPDAQPPSAPNRKKGRKVAEPVKIGSFSELPTVYEAGEVHKAPLEGSPPPAAEAVVAGEPPRPWRNATVQSRKRRASTSEDEGAPAPTDSPVPSAEREAVDDVPIIARRSGDSDGAIKIGFQDDDSWRAVKVPSGADARGAPLGRQSLLLVALATLLTVAMGVALFLLLRSSGDGTNPASPAASRSAVGGLVVTFKLEATDGTSTAGKSGRLIALKVPPGSGLQAGDVLATVPGPVLFPIAGEYSLRIRLEGYQARDFALNVQDNRDVVIRLDQSER